MDYEKMWYELKEYLMVNDIVDVVLHMSEQEVYEIFKSKNIRKETSTNIKRPNNII